MLKSALLAASVMGMTAQVWAADPLVGTWELNLAKSKFSPGPAPKAETRVYEAQEGGIKVTVRTLEADGRSTTVHIAANYDGKDYPVAGSSDYDAIELKRVGEQAVEAKLLHAGKLFAIARREISEDGRTITISYKTVGDMAKPIDNKAVYDRQ
jgi:hypothetical protein